MDNDQRSPFEEPELEAIHRGLHFESEDELEPDREDSVVGKPGDGVDGEPEKTVITPPVEGETEVASVDDDTAAFGLPPISRLPLDREEKTR